MKLKDIKLPEYTKGEEIVNSISHGMGIGIAIVCTIIGIIFSCYPQDNWAIVACSIYGFSLILLYAMSTIYHILPYNNGKKVLRIFDHCSIFILIAGTYTPYTLIALRQTVGWTFFGIVWGAAIIGIILNSINLKKFEILSMICYLAMGWVIVIAFKPLTQSMKTGGIVLLIVGGLLYTIGAILYALGKKRKYMHSVWHFFVLGGSILHYLSIILFVIIKI